MKYLCMPMAKNVKSNFIINHPGAKIVICPECECECYETAKTRKIKNLPGYKAVCTECALRLGLNQK